MRALVTGASGFIGSHLAERLVKDGWQVRCLLRSTSSSAWLEGLPIEVVTDDLVAPRDLSRAVSGVDAVFHAAGVTKASRARDYHEGNVLATRNLLDACRRRGPGRARFILISSLSAAGPSPQGRPRTEEDPPCPVSWYGRSKLLAEEALGASENIVPATIIRPPIVYGPRDRDYFRCFQSVAAGLHLVPGNGSQRIVLIHVADLVEGILLAAASDRAVGKTYFISHHEDVDWIELGAMLREALHCRAITLPAPKNLMKVLGACGSLLSTATGKAFVLNADKMREGLQPSWLCSNRKAREELGFRPTVGLREGLAACAIWYRNVGWL